MRPCLLLSLTLACNGADGPSGPAPSTCHLVVTDIDETLTTLDSEFFLQLADASHDPAMRPDANTMMSDYANLGYTIAYITARGESMQLSDGTPARDATVAWLQAHDFPTDPELVYLAPGVGAIGDGAVSYKANVMNDLVADGHVLDWAYGNATTDIEAFQQAGIPNDHIFLVGVLAGGMGVEPIPDEDAYTSHLASQLPAVDEVEACAR